MFERSSMFLAVGVVSSCTDAPMNSMCLTAIRVENGSVDSNLRFEHRASSLCMSVHWLK